MHKTLFATVTAIIGLTVLTLWAAPNPTADHAAIEKAVLKANAALAQAEKSLDAEKFFSHIPDFDKGLILQNGVMYKTRQEALDVVKTGFQGVSRVERVYDRTYVTVISPETALLTAQGTSSVTLLDGRIVSTPFAVSSLFVLRDGQWRLLHGHYSSPNPQ